MANVVTLTVTVAPSTLRFPVTTRSPEIVPPEVESLVLEDAKAPLAYEAAELAV